MFVIIKKILKNPNMVVKHTRRLKNKKSVKTIKINTRGKSVKSIRRKYQRGGVDEPKIESNNNGPYNEHYNEPLYYLANNVNLEPEVKPEAEPANTQVEARITKNIKELNNYINTLVNKNKLFSKNAGVDKLKQVDNDVLKDYFAIINDIKVKDFKFDQFNSLKEKLDNLFKNHQYNELVNNSKFFFIKDILYKKILYNVKNFKTDPDKLKKTLQSVLNSGDFKTYTETVITLYNQMYAKLEEAGLNVDSISSEADFVKALTDYLDDQKIAQDTRNTIDTRNQILSNFCNSINYPLLYLYIFRQGI
jgi:hypothetical protein